MGSERFGILKLQREPQSEPLQKVAKRVSQSTYKPRKGRISLDTSQS